jgi:hypothetical protein
MKKLFYLVALVFITNCSYGQFRVLSNSVFEFTNGRFTIKTNNPTVDIGCNEGTGNYNSTLYFWHGDSKWNNLKAHSYIVMSDANLKTNLMPIENASEIINNINTYSYSMVDNLEITNYGVLAQELEPILPNLVDTTHGELGVNYIGLIPFLISGFQEKSKALDNLQNEIQMMNEENIQLRNLVEELLNTLNNGLPNLNPKSAQSTSVYKDDKPILYQNNPNPFTLDTKIHYYLPTTCNTAMLVIYDLQGHEIVSYQLTYKGEHDCLIQGSQLNAGMYIYALIVDNRIVDTKRMILTK